MCAVCSMVAKGTYVIPNSAQQNIGILEFYSLFDEGVKQTVKDPIEIFLLKSIEVRLTSWKIRRDFFF